MKPSAPDYCDCIFLLFLNKDIKILDLDPRMSITAGGLYYAMERPTGQFSSTSREPLQKIYQSCSKLITSNNNKLC